MSAPKRIKFQWPIIRELIGRVRSVVITTRYRWAHRPTKDLTRPDSAFWDKARRGLAEGLEISGLLLKPLQSKVASWVMGKPLQFKMQNPRNQEALIEWWAKYHPEIIFGYEEAVGLGNYFLVINPDLSVTAVPDYIVDPIVATDDYSKIIGWKITERFQHPTEIGKYMIVINEYTETERTKRVQFETGPEIVERFPNLIGICPVIHVPNNRMSNEMWGQPEGAALVAGGNRSMLHRYGEILDAGLDGNILQGRPTPTIKFNDPAAVEQFMGTYGTLTVDEKTGEKDFAIEWTADKLMAVAGEFKYASPGSFSGDTEKLLSILYWLMLEHIEIPEFVMGTAIASSKASTETQMPIFVKWIEKKRGQVGGWVQQVARVVNALQALTEPGVSLEEPAIVWDSLTNEDGQLTQQFVEWAFAEGLIDRKTALMLAPKKVEDIDAVLKKAEEERAASSDQQQDLAYTQFLNGQGQDQNQDGNQDQQMNRAA